MTDFAGFLILTLVIPWLAAIALWFTVRRNRDLGGITCALISMAVFVWSITMYPQVYSGNLKMEIKGIFMGKASFALIPLGYSFVLLTSIVWFAASLFSVPYMRSDRNPGRYYFFFLVTLGATLGVFLSGDMVVLFTFFEIMSLASFMLVVHTQNRESLQAGILYIFMSILGSLVALMGIFMLYHTAGTLDIASLQGTLSGGQKDNMVTYMLIVLGFGVKAGIVPFHIWLPRAHPAAPAPASAVLSGILLKTGIYCMLIASLIFLESSLPAAKTVMSLGAVTLIMGAFSAFRSNNLKKLLAYSSMSQMGYVVMSLGAGLAVVEKEWLGYAGALYQSINHGLYEAMLFLLAGYLYITVHRLEMDRLRGAVKKIPSLAMFLILGLAAISGFPGLNGFVGKTLIHEGLVEVVHQYPFSPMWIYEKLFFLGSALTAAYSFRILVYFMTGDFDRGLIIRLNLKDSLYAYLALSVLSAGVILTGLMPGRVLTLLEPINGQNQFHMPEVFTIHSMAQALKVYVCGATILAIFSSRNAGLFSKSKRYLTGISSAIWGAYSRVRERFITVKVLPGAGKLEGFHRVVKGLATFPAYLSNVIRGAVTALDANLDVEVWPYTLARLLYRLFYGIFEMVDRGIDSLYSFCTSYLAGIYQNQGDGEPQQVFLALQFKGTTESGRRYGRIFWQDILERVRKAGVNTRRYLQEKEHSTLNLNVGIIIFAMVIVILMIIFGLYTPLIKNIVLSTSSFELL